MHVSRTVAAALAATLTVLAAAGRRRRPGRPGRGPGDRPPRLSADGPREHSAAMDQAVAAGSDRVSIDVRLTRDGVPVVRPRRRPGAHHRRRAEAPGARSVAGGRPDPGAGQERRRGQLVRRRPLHRRVGAHPRRGAARAGAEHDRDDARGQGPRLLRRRHRGRGGGEADARRAPRVGRPSGRRLAPARRRVLRLGLPGPDARGLPRPPARAARERRHSGPRDRPVVGPGDRRAFRPAHRPRPSPRPGASASWSARGPPTWPATCSGRWTAVPPA